MPATDRPVSDLVIVLGDPPACDVAAMLGDRPGLERSEIRTIETAWGHAWVQHPFPDGSSAVRNERVVVGRAVVRGASNPDGESADDWLERRGGVSAEPESASDALSGMFAVFEFHERGLRVLTDRLGFRPVYIGRDEDGRVRAVGTHAETVAAASGTGDRIDPVSVAELLVHNFITFPFTTRTTMAELPPASLCEIDGDGVDSKTLWEPSEPDRFPSPGQMQERIADAMREAAADVTHGCDRVAVLLSGGADSRAVLGAVQGAIGEGTELTGLTYVTRENNETRVAARIAEAAGCAHVLVKRDEHYFPRMLGRGLALLGCELRGNCHGLGVADQGLGDRFDVVIGGQLSDTLLKDHFMSMRSRHEHRTPTLKQCVRSVIPGLRRPPPESSEHHTTGRHRLEPMLTDEIRDAVRARRIERLEAVRRVRPTTAEVWNRFWPCSRQDDSAHTLGNTRIMQSDTLYAHSAIVDVACELSLDARVDGVPANLAITDVCGPLASIENANNGLPIDATPKQIRAARKARRAKAAERAAPSDDSAPWNAVETSWVDPKLMQQHAPEWVAAREQLSGSPAMSFLDGIIARGGHAMIGSYQDDLPSNTNHIAVQIAVWLDSVLSPSDPAAVGGPG